VIDICQHPELAKEEQIIAAPALIKKHPMPRKLMVGDLSDQDMVKRCLGISSLSI
jgi:circadian clock protein KaiB